MTNTDDQSNTETTRPQTQGVTPEPQRITYGPATVEFTKGMDEADFIQINANRNGRFFVTLTDPSIEYTYFNSGHADTIQECLNELEEWIKATKG
jgi:hypothetical protein